MTRSEEERACSRGLVFVAMYGISNNVISRKLLIFSMCLSGQKMFLFNHIVDSQDEIPAHPSLEKKKTVSEITVESNRAGPCLARPVHHGYRLHGQKEAFFVT